MTDRFPLQTGCIGLCCRAHEPIVEILEPENNLYQDGNAEKRKKCYKHLISGAFTRKIHALGSTMTLNKEETKCPPFMLVCGERDFSGSQQIMVALREELKKQGLDEEVSVVQTGCHGLVPG